MKKKMVWKRATSIALMMSLMGTLPQTFTGYPLQAYARETDQAQKGYLANVTNRVQVQINGQQLDLNMYENGRYEGAMFLKAGSYQVQTLLNHAAFADAKSLLVDQDQMVWFSFENGVLKNSVEEKEEFHTAAFTGALGQLPFKDGKISDWDPSDENAELEYLGGGLYKRTFTFDALAEDTQIEYKVALDDKWDESYGQDGENVKVTIPSGSTAFSVFFDHETGQVFDSVRTPAFQVTQNDGTYALDLFEGTVSLIGDVRSGDSDWDAAKEGYEFTQISDHLYLYQKDMAAGSYNYKAVFDHQKWYEKSGNQSLTVPEDTTVTYLYDAQNEMLYDSINQPSAVAQILGLEAAPAKAEVRANANGTTTFVTIADQAQKVSLVYGRKEVVESDPSAMRQVEMKKQEDGSYQTQEMFLGDAAADILYYYLVDGVKVLDADAETEHIKEEPYSSYSKAAFEGRGVNVPGTFPGPSWNASSNQMEYKGNGLYAYTFKQVPAANYEFKISMGSWSENYGVDGIKGGGNYGVTVTEKQDVTVYYNDFSHRAVTSLNYQFADVDLSGTGIEPGTKLTDSSLTGIYSATVELKAGTYPDVAVGYNGQSYQLEAFTLQEDRAVTFYFDPDSEVYYCDASDDVIDTAKIYYNTKEKECKSVYGAVATGEKVTFGLQTGEDVTKVRMIIKGTTKKNVELEKNGAVENGVQKWKTDLQFDQIGQNTYYFVIYKDNQVVTYGDDDGYYGTGTVTDLMQIKPYDLVVYKSGYKTPDWMKEGIVYQIFPERFFDGDTSNDQAVTQARGAAKYEYVTDWYQYPENPEQEALNPDAYPAEAVRGDGNYNNEIYGGDLQGIIQKVDYLKALGVNVIYLNPVFQSISSHRYDTSDYSKIDPILGTMGDFKELVSVAEKNDMHIVLDGVFNHVADDSKYFDRYYKYLKKGTKSIGAYPYWAYVFDYQNKNNVDQETAEKAAHTYFKKKYGVTDYTYTTWFEFYGKDSYITDDQGNKVVDKVGDRTGAEDYVYSYDSWWGYDSMPVIIAKNGSEYQTQSWAKEIIGTNEDTAEEDGSIAKFWLAKGSNGWRLDVANEVSDETWQHFRGSVKALDSDNVIIGEIWDDATKYLLGDMYDSVMNYVFRNAVLSYAKGGRAEDSVKILEKIRERYPKEAFYAMMNLVASHDTTRVLSYLDGIDDDRSQKEPENAFPTVEKTSDLAKQRQYLVAFLQMTYAGAPTIYYGDEIGMVGADDPDDRRAFTWGKGEEGITKWYATLGNIRKNCKTLRTGDVDVLDLQDDSLMGYVRKDDTATMTIVANNAQETKNVTIDATALGYAENETLVDVITKQTYTVTNGQVQVQVQGLRGVILTTQANDVAVELDTESLKQAYDPAYIIDSEKRQVVEKVAFDQKKVELAKGKTVKIKASVTPEKAIHADLKFSVEDKSIASIQTKGNTVTIKALKAGTTKITAVSRNGKKATCSVKVTVPATKITLDKKNITLKKDASMTLHSKLTPAASTDSVTYTSSNTKVATVSKSGKITAKKAGTAVITAVTASGKKATCKVKVVVPATSVTLKKTRLTLKAGKSVELKAVLRPADSTDPVTYTSSDKKVATVSKKGKVTAKKAGTAVITVKTASGKKASCKVTVK